MGDGELGIWRGRSRAATNVAAVGTTLLVVLTLMQAPAGETTPAATAACPQVAAAPVELVSVPVVRVPPAARAGPPTRELAYDAPR